MILLNFNCYGFNSNCEQMNSAGVFQGHIGQFTQVNGRPEIGDSARFPGGNNWNGISGHKDIYICDSDPGIFELKHHFPVTQIYELK